MPTTVAVTRSFVSDRLRARRSPAGRLALLVGVTGWALCTGFAVNQFGQLTFAATDLVRLAAYVRLGAGLSVARRDTMTASPSGGAR